MRMSRVLTGGAVIAAAVAGGSAFTAANELEETTYAGFDSETVSGAVVLNTAYNVDPADQSKLASIVFTAEGNLEGTKATLRLLNGGVDSGAVPNCLTGAHDANIPGETPITCTFTPTLAFVDFDEAALTVVSE